MANILSILSVCGRHGGTTVKLKKLVENSRHNHFVYFALYDKDSIINYPENKAWFRSPNVKIYEGFWSRNIIKYIIDLTKIIRMNEINIIHLYFNFESSFAPLLKLLFPNIILIRSFEGYIELPKVRYRILNTSFRFVDNFIYISNYIKSKYEQLYPILKKKNNTIIYNEAINVSDIITEPKDRKYLVSISGLCPPKNLTILIKSIGIVVHKYKRKCKLYILGDGPSRDEIVKLIDNLEVSENVILLGYTSQVVEYLNKCSIYVHPADNEGFGIAVTEAMYMKCPVIVSRAGALPELVGDSLSGFVVDPYNPDKWASKIVQLLDDPNLRIKMANEAYKWVRNAFPINSYINNHDELYDKLLK